MTFPKLRVPGDYDNNDIDHDKTQKTKSNPEPSSFLKRWMKELYSTFWRKSFLP